MTRRRLSQLFIALIIFVALALSYQRLTAYYPTVQQWLINTYDDLMLPVRIARLSAQEPDETILMPVEGILVRQVADTWGAPRSGGRRHEGQDIFAERHTPIYAATEGYVTRITDNTLGGNSIFIVGAGGRRYYYTHLESFADIEEGDFVTPETVIGFVGNSGNASTTPPHLHFGVYTRTGAINPLPLMVDRP